MTKRKWCFCGHWAERTRHRMKIEKDGYPTITVQVCKKCADKCKGYPGLTVMYNRIILE